MFLINSVQFMHGVLHPMFYFHFIYFLVLKTSPVSQKSKNSIKETNTATLNINLIPWFARLLNKILLSSAYNYVRYL